MNRNENVELILSNVFDWESSCREAFISDLLDLLTDEQVAKIVNDQGFEK